MYNENKIILGSTSLWCLVLTYHSYLEHFYFLSLLLGFITILSPLSYYEYDCKSNYYKLNKCLSIICLLYVSCQDFYLIHNLKFYISNISLLIFFYVVSRKSTVLELFSYLLFRWYYFILIFKFIIKTKNQIYFNNCTSIYFINNCYLAIIGINNNNSYYDNYISCCIEVFITIIINHIVTFNSFLSNFVSDI